jgi:hypothetical protein
MHTLLQRYSRGEHVEVWAELTALGNQVRIEPTCEDALGVVRETMRRVRHNLELLVPRLHDFGFAFGAGFLDDYSSEEAQEVMRHAPILGAPAPNVLEQIAELEALTGTLPMSLRGWYELVGTVNLIGMKPDWPRGRLPHGLDPLFVNSIETAIEMVREYSEMGVWQQDPVLSLAPDEFHKYGISGLGSYGLQLPDEAADALLLHEWHGTTFMNYVRIALHWAGMPGLEASSALPSDDLRYLTDGFLPLLKSTTLLTSPKARGKKALPSCTTCR